MKKYLIHLVCYVIFALVVWVALNVYFGLNPWPEGYCEGAPDLCSWQYWKERLPSLPLIALLSLGVYIVGVAIARAIKQERRKSNEQKG